MTGVHTSFTDFASVTGAAGAAVAIDIVEAGGQVHTRGRRALVDLCSKQHQITNNGTVSQHVKPNGFYMP